ncbi:MAG TPA: hypothetical protein VE129_13470 [Thermoanaerobaculia bacterium]|nr:hypothetical protein [Thermoanaerobaculia bacterium]
MKDDSARAIFWMEQWRVAGPALEEVRERELRDLTDEQALEAAEELLSMVSSLPLPPERLGSSGLVMQQALLHRRASR